jgi:peroxiredoxin
MPARSPERRRQIDTLTTRLSDLLASRRQGAAWDAAYLQILARLNHEGFLSQVIAPGAAFPDFVLPSAEGRLVALGDALAKGPVVLCFFRGDWCPFCRLMLGELAERLGEIEAAGATLLALTPETGGLPLTMKQRNGARFQVLADVDFGVGLAAGVVYKIPPLYRGLLEAGGLDFPQRHGNGAWCLPVPACFVIRPDGIIAWRFLDADFSHRPETGAIIDAVRRL